MKDPAPIHVVAAVLRRGDRYLVCRRPANKRHGGLWEFPGGKLVGGETRADALRRELDEELGLEVLEHGSVLFEASDEGSPFVIEFIETTAVGDLVLHEHSEAAWLTPTELATIPLAPADARFAARLRDPAH